MDEPVSKGTRTAFVAIVGRPSAGKSTLLNSICGHKVSITSPVPQTTRNRIRGIANRDEGQLIFIDTPGFHESTRTFNRHMRGLIDETVRDCEVVLYVIDASRAPGAEERALISSLSRLTSTPIVVAMNKCDVAKRPALEGVDSFVREFLPAVPIVAVSALKGRGIEELIGEIFTHAPTGVPHYPADFYTDQPPEFRVAEIIREKAMDGMREELPHAVYVEIADMEIGTDEAGRERLWIRAFLMVERESQKGMMVGKGGDRIKRTRQEAQKEIASLFPYTIYLDLRVKVDPQWRTNARVLDKLVT